MTSTLRFLLDAVKAYGLYLGLVVTGTGLLMFLATSIGYSTYSDRPGTGWFGFHPNLSIQNAEFLLGFVLFTASMSILLPVIPGLMLVAVALRRFKIPRVMIALMLIPMLGYATFWLFEVSGWYIAMDGAFAIVGALICIPFALAVSSAEGFTIGRLRVRAF